MTNAPEPRTLLRAAAARAEADPFFLGWALAAYARAHELSGGELAAYLGAEQDNLTRLALCRRPDTQASGFRAQVERVARYAGVEPLRLGMLLLEVATAEALAGDADADVLLAARDHPEDEEGV